MRSSVWGDSALWEKRVDPQRDPVSSRVDGKKRISSEIAPRRGGELMTVDADRRLLFGLLALQNGLIDQAQLVAAFHAWTREKSRPLADHLVALGHVDADGRAAVAAMADLHLKRHGGNVEKTLSVLHAGPSTRKGLAGLDDPDIDGTLGHVKSGSTEDGGGADQTASYAVGSATSVGQRFRVLRPHAKGGLGAVFVALDAELHREVALKQILDGHADDPVSRQRFVLEAEITGGLEHPGIVPVYGLGAYADGRPYYAMRFIRGDSLKEAVARFHADSELKDDPGARTLALRKLLRRFTDVCNAIDYAHSRGVLHRDIKPGNVIVGRHGETLVVDWGLAKALGKREAGDIGDERTLAPTSGESNETLPGAALGTPAYMSPEQAAGDLDLLGPRSDVYSLGATLYCLLTGKPPFEGEDLGAIMQGVRTGRFPPPRAVDPSIDRALEAVCLKAMAARPVDRYASCRALADDIERWGADEPVSAWREPAARRARRWMRRNRTAVTTAAAAVLVALVGTAAVAAVQTRANGALTRLNHQLFVANDRVTRSNAALVAERERVQARFDLAMEAIQTFHTGVSEDVLMKRREFGELRTRLLRGAIEFYRKMQGLLTTQADRASREALARSYASVGDLTNLIGSKADALAAHSQALSVREELARDPAAGDGARAAAASSLLKVAVLLRETGRPDEAMAACRNVVSTLEPLAAADPKAVDYRVTLANCYNSIAMAHHTAGRLPETIAEMRKAHATFEDVVRIDPASPSHRSSLANNLNNLGVLEQQVGRFSEAEVLYRRALAIREALAAASPDNPAHRNAVGRTLNSLGTLCKDRDRFDDAVAF
jgi:eukaryotic-like serine/threonine-protein kinase